MTGQRRTWFGCTPAEVAHGGAAGSEARRGPGELSASWP